MSFCDNILDYNISIFIAFEIYLNVTNNILQDNAKIV